MIVKNNCSLQKALKVLTIRQFKGKVKKRTAGIVTFPHIGAVIRSLLISSIITLINFNF